MTMKQYLLALFCLLCVSVNGQSVKNGQEYQRFYLSLNEGWSFALGSSNTAIADNITLPASKNGYSPSFDGAFFFSKNYGVGIKYGFYTSKLKEESFREFTDPTENIEMYEYNILSFKERTHSLGPAVYGRWILGESRWMINANAGVVALHNKLYEIKTINANTAISSQSVNFVDASYSQVMEMYAVDHTGITAGFTLSAGIRFQVFSFAGISLQTNGLYASLSKMKYYNLLENRDETGDFSRKIGRIGLSAAIDFSF